MTPEQIVALESLVGRALTVEESAELAPLIELRNDVGIAAVLSNGRIAVQSKMIGIGTILMALAPYGGDFLDGLTALGATDRNVFWSMELLKAGTFDIGLPGTRAQLDALMTAYPALAGGLGALLATAEVAAPVQFNAVSDALNRAEGRMTL